jgi:ATP adenylyltransferase
LLTAYETLLQHLELISGSLDSNAIDPEATDTEMTDTEATENSSVIPAYNLLVTRTWMMIVPRSQESFESISVNSLGFAGTLLVRNADQLEQIKAAGPLNVISAVARPA